MKKVLSALLVAAMTAAISTCTFAATLHPNIEGRKYPTIGESGADYKSMEMNFHRYGGEKFAKLDIDKADGVTLRMKKEINEGEEVIKKVTLKDDCLTIEAKFPSDLKEPEPYSMDIELTSSDGRDYGEINIFGTVYYQDSDGPVSPEEYEEERFVVVDFAVEDCSEMDFKGGHLYVDSLHSGVVNLDVSYAENDVISVKHPNAYLDFTSFTASPKLSRSITVGLDANKEDYVYRINANNTLEALETKYDTHEGELQFSARQLGSYVVSNEKLIEEKLTTKPVENKTSNTANKPASSTVDIRLGQSPPENGPQATTKQNPGTGAYPEENGIFAAPIA